MKSILPAHAEHQLAQVADRFDAWRQARTTRAEPIPPDLWEQAIALTAMFPLTRVARRIRVSGGELKKRCTAHHTTQAAPTSTALGFVEVTTTPVWEGPTEGHLRQDKLSIVGNEGILHGGNRSPSRP